MAVAQWQAQGYSSDPMLDSWRRLSTLTQGDLQDFLGSFLRSTRTLVVYGPVASIDLDALEVFGEIERLSADELFGT